MKLNLAYLSSLFQSHDLQRISYIFKSLSSKKKDLIKKIEKEATRSNPKHPMILQPSNTPHRRTIQQTYPPLSIDFVAARLPSPSLLPPSSLTFWPLTIFGTVQSPAISPFGCCVHARRPRLLVFQDQSQVGVVSIGC